MSIEVIDLVDMGHTEKRRKNVFNTPRFHAWMHYCTSRGTKTPCIATTLTRLLSSSKENAR